MRRPGRGRWTWCAALAAALASIPALPAGEAAAFCRTTTCKGQDACNGEEIAGCTPLAWKRTCIGFALQEDASEKVPLEDARASLSDAFYIWQSADCGGAPPGLAIQDMGTVTCGEVEYNSEAGNANLMVFRDGVWPHEGGQHNIALTTVSYDPNTGELYNADIEVNTAGYDFSGEFSYDLTWVLTHETGHFLGLGHSEPPAIMQPSYDPSQVGGPDLSPDDVAGICAAYPPADLDPGRCNPIPRHGFAPLCGDAQTPGCSVAPGEQRGSGSGQAVRAVIAGALAVVAAVVARAVRRART
ncbi:matrixin family metalloprotease [Chondromyces apiculatus]|nr:matrixin family metalloprotease [Chondromyces apiculatus]